MKEPLESGIYPCYECNTVTETYWAGWTLDLNLGLVHPVAPVFNEITSQFPLFATYRVLYYIVYSKDEISCEQRKLTCDFVGLWIFERTWKDCIVPVMNISALQEALVEVRTEGCRVLNLSHMELPLCLAVSFQM
jgi:hypothetical protein